MLRTIEDLLGIEPLGLYDAALEPMADVFQPAPADWTYAAVVPEILRSTQLPLPRRTHAKSSTGPVQGHDGRFAPPHHDAAYWEEKMKGLDFSVEDRLDTDRFNRALWEGIRGEEIPYPEFRDGRNLRRHRHGLLRNTKTWVSSATTTK
jgi:hypothetical protein